MYVSSSLRESNPKFNHDVPITQRFLQHALVNKRIFEIFKGKTPEISVIIFSYLGPLQWANITVLTIGQDRKVILGIGRTICKEDVGQKLIRTAPPRNGDLSYIESDLEKLDSEAVLILEVTNDYIKYKGQYSVSHLERPCWDHDWMTVAGYRAFRQQHSLDAFKTVPRVTNEVVQTTNLDELLEQWLRATVALLAKIAMLSSKSVAKK